MFNHTLVFSGIYLMVKSLVKMEGFAWSTQEYEVFVLKSCINELDVCCFLLFVTGESYA